MERGEINVVLLHEVLNVRFAPVCASSWPLPAYYAAVPEAHGRCFDETVPNQQVQPLVFRDLSPGGRVALVDVLPWAAPRAGHRRPQQDVPVLTGTNGLPQAPRRGDVVGLGEPDSRDSSLQRPGAQKRCLGTTELNDLVDPQGRQPLFAGGRCDSVGPAPRADSDVVDEAARIVPFDGVRERLGEYVSSLLVGSDVAEANVFTSNYFVEPRQIHSVGSSDMTHCRKTPALHHFERRFIVFVRLELAIPCQHKVEEWQERQPLSANGVLERDELRFRRGMRYACLFLGHASDGNACVCAPHAGENAGS